MTKFKVGDKLVRCDISSYGRHNYGSVGIVSEIYGYNVLFENDPNAYDTRKYTLFKEPEMNQTKKPHVHAECIKAWADGATIEFRCGGEYEWRDLKTTCPSWSEGFQYRIKPETKPDIEKFIRVEIVGRSVCLIHPRDGDRNLKLTFDGETGKLKKAEVI